MDVGLNDRPKWSIVQCWVENSDADDRQRPSNQTTASSRSDENENIDDLNCHTVKHDELLLNSLLIKSALADYSNNDHNHTEIVFLAETARST